MSETPPSGAGQEPVYFGFVEAVCFGGLFLSPLLPESTRVRFWILLVAFRMIGALACLGLGAVAKAPGPMASFLGRGLLYQLPFWVSALAFPLATGQRASALTALLIQVGLAGLLLVLSLLERRFLLPALYYGSVFWLYGTNLSEPSHWICLGVGVLTLVPGRALRPELLQGNRFMQGFAVGLAWLACVGLAPLGSESERATLLRVLLPWCLLCVIGLAVFDTVRRMALSRWSREGEWSLPALSDGTRWLAQRRLGLLATLVPLLGLVTLQWRDLVVWVIVLTACDRALSLATSGRTSSESLAWWASWEFLLLWGASRTAGPVVWAWLGVALLSSWLARRHNPMGVAEVNLSGEGLGEVLRAQLCLKAPENFAASVQARLEPSVELDQELRAAAPVGFRQRLLERLQSQAEDEELEA